MDVVLFLENIKYLLKYMKTDDDDEEVSVSVWFVRSVIFTSMVMMITTGTLVILQMSLLMSNSPRHKLRNRMHVVIAMCMFIVTTLNLIIFVYTILDT